MTGLLVKLLLFPAIVYFSDVLLPGIRFINPVYAIGTGLTLAILAHAFEVVVLQRGTLWVSTAADFLTALAVLFGAGVLLPNTVVTLGSAAVAAAVLSAAELAVHSLLIEGGMTAKHPPDDAD
ncbi:MAG: hypothetical protein ACM3QZ_12555 [Solirubrobacterales bacterium]